MRLYISPQLPSTLGGVENLFQFVKKINIKRNDVEHFLLGIDALHKEIRRQFKTRHVVARGRNEI